MESCVVLFNKRIHLFACNHPSVSNTCDCNDWFVHKHRSTALRSNTFGWWFLVCLQASDLSHNGYGWYCLHGSDVNFVFLHVMSGVPNSEKVVMGTSTVAWMPLPLPCRCAGVRRRRTTRGYSCAVFSTASMYRAGCPACRQFKLLGSFTRRSLNCFRR